MSALTELLGSSLLSNDKKVSTEEALAGKQAVALYFSGHWCPPCRGFTPQLAEWYRKDLKSKGLEVIFVSSDRDEASFKEYFAEQPWLALPYEDRDTKEKLSKKFKVQGIPSLVILDAAGNTITTEGREALSADPTGKEFPWKPVPLPELLSQATVFGAHGEQLSIQQAVEGKKALALYFSAHWCPPCRGFTPQLAEWYKTNLKGKGLEVVFVSSDRDEASFKEYFAEQPWLALDYSQRSLKEKLSKAFKVQGIPSLVILDSELNTVTTEGRGAVSADPEGLEMPWYPKPVSNLKQGPGNINEEPTVLVFCETSSPDEQKAFESALEPVAKKFIEKQKATGEDLEFGFIISTEASGLAPRIRSMLGLPSLPLQPHEHPMELSERASGWGCDGCSCSGAGKERYRCTKGCDFDFCGDCYAKLTAGGKVEKMAPRMALIDIPSDGAYYLSDEGTSISTVAVEKFVADFQAGKLERRQLS
eukprot:TRINITY_DN1400_c0_g1_i1.p1 TRINITY_DN1400_c0_g1~~TRINITY_DN1400_c0_g1_i1.p1  ORF type:complete len:477 (+),score=130.60 TRINITY_DN1400_c0_g1_i1:81-1511(+)